MNFPELGRIFDRLSDIPPSTLITAGAAGFIAFAAGLAFARGVMKQLLNMVALAAAAMAGWYVFTHRDWAVGGGQSVHIPTDRLMLFSVGAALAAFFAVKAGIHFLAAFGIFKLLGNLNGWKGMIVSMLPSGFLLWLASAGLRLVGNIYGLEHTAEMVDKGKQLESHAASFWLKLSQRIDQSSLGSIAARVDPFDMRAIANLARLLILWPEGSVWHKLAAKNQQTNDMLHHPRIQELGRDPKVRKAIETQDFAGLIQLRQVVDAASHPDLEPVLSGLELEQDMDAIVYKRPQPVRLR